MAEKSFEKLNYLLRPSKQVERKLLIESLHYLAQASYPIYGYTYVGFGSIYYADFLLFHKYLYLNKMMCVEHGKIPNRMRFNKPFKFIKLKMKPISEVIPQLSRKTKYLVWLDYDGPLTTRMLADIDGFSKMLAAGSILIITVDAEPDHLVDPEEDFEIKSGEEVAKFLDDTFGHLIVDDITEANLTKNDLPQLLSRILRSQLSTSLASRSDVDFHQLFNFLYADGAQMITVGGVIDDGSAIGKLERSGVFDLEYIQKGEDLVRITVPPLTIREKQWIDSNLAKNLSAKKKLDIDDTLLANYVRFYKYYPTYYETLV